MNDQREADDRRGGNSQGRSGSQGENVHQSGSGSQGGNTSREVGRRHGIESHREAMFWDAAENNIVRCGLCPHRCRIPPGAAGYCRVRENREGELIAAGYGQVSSVALDPIEKKPLYMFHPGKNILSIGGFGCNFRCPFCQNFEISMKFDALRQNARLMRPHDIAELAVRTVQDGNIGVAYTYNEPLIGYEFVYDCAKLVREAGLCNVLVTNGYINEEPLEMLLPMIDAMNIDLKGFTGGFYNEVSRPNMAKPRTHNIGTRTSEADRRTLEEVKRTIIAAQALCHVEVTTLVIPGSDSQGNENDIEELAKWLASIDSSIPLHLTRFFPRFQMTDRAPTPRETIIRLRETAKKYLTNVFAGNM